MAAAMPTDWAPPQPRRTYPQTARPRARWREYADGHWWRFHQDTDLPPGQTLSGAYRAAWMWAAGNGLTCESWRDQEAGVLYLRFTPSTTTRKEAA